MTDDTVAPKTSSDHSELGKLIRRVLRPVASLQLTVALFVLALLLVFFGTLAQINSGVWTVMHDYFRSWVVWVPVQLFAEFAKVFFELNKETEWKGSFPFPAGNLIGFALLGNLLAAHALRFRMTWKRSGIFLIHSGMIILMLGEFFTGQFAVESRMVLQLGETGNFLDDSRKVEIVLTDPIEGNKLHVFTIPQWMFDKPGWIRSDKLPVDFRVQHYWPNSDALRTASDEESELLFDLNGSRYELVPCDEESGVKTGREDAPMVELSVFKKGTDEVLGHFVLSLWQYANYNNRLLQSAPKTFSYQGTTYTIALRNRRITQDFNVELLNFEHKKYPGTTKAKEYASTVQLRDPENGEDREILIRMNHPLRYQGLTFYQSGVLPGDTGTILQVVDNPVWILPYLSCIVVSVGMMIHFGISLIKFQQRRMAQ